MRETERDKRWRGKERGRKDVGGRDRNSEGQREDERKEGVRQREGTIG